VIKKGLSDSLPNCLELDLLRIDAKLQEQVANRATEIIEKGCFTTDDFHQLELVEFPKQQYGARRLCAVIDPLDSVAYLALAILAAPSIEQHRKPAREQTVFSYRFAPRNGKIFDSRYCYASFMEAVELRLKTHGFIVKCDVKKFYQGVTPALVGEALRRCHVIPCVGDYVTDLLTFWTQSGLQGLPVGCNASRIFAEAVLIPIDEALDAQGIDYIRFVDDMYLFTDSYDNAQQALQTLREVLGVSKFGLNPEKTRIFPILPSVGAVGSQKPPRQSRGGRDQRRSYGEAETATRYDSVQKHFRPATSHEFAVMCAVADPPDLSILLNGTLAPRRYVRQSLRRALHLNHIEIVKAIPELVDRYPELSHYILDGLSVCAQRIHPAVRSDLSTGLRAILLARETPQFVCLNIISLLATPDYCQREALERYVQDRLANPTGVCFRTALDALRRTGGIPIDIHHACDKEDIWTKRTLLADSKAELHCSMEQMSDPFTKSIIRWRLGETGSADIQI
jgi:hypothetical protein